MTGGPGAPVRVHDEREPTGRKAAGKTRWKPSHLPLRPTPHGVGLGKTDAPGSWRPTDLKGRYRLLVMQIAPAARPNWSDSHP